MSVPSDQTAADKGSIVYQQCDVTSWPSLCSAFESIPHIDIAVANAGVSEECDYFTDTFDASGKLEEPRYNVLNVNYRAVLNFIKLSLRAFRRQQPGGGGGSLVITTSATAYSPEQSLPVYSATKLAVSIRCLLLLYDGLNGKAGLTFVFPYSSSASSAPFAPRSTFPARQSTPSPQQPQSPASYPPTSQNPSLRPVRLSVMRTMSGSR